MTEAETARARADFIHGYLICALWSSSDDEDTPLDQLYGISDFTPDAEGKCKSSCNDFFDANRADIETACSRPGYTFEYAGHDFWLSRNGHGAGYFDRGLGKEGDQLQAAARAYGSVDLYVSDHEGTKLIDIQ